MVKRSWSSRYGSRTGPSKRETNSSIEIQDFASPEVRSPVGGVQDLQLKTLSGGGVQLNSTTDYSSQNIEHAGRVLRSELLTHRRAMLEATVPLLKDVARESLLIGLPAVSAIANGKGVPILVDEPGIKRL